MVTDGAAVHFFLDIGEQCESGAVAMDGNLSALLRDGTGAVTIVLDQAVQGNIQIIAPQNGCYRRHVFLSTIQEDQIGLAPESHALILVGKVFLDTAVDDLLHRGVVVAALGHLNAEFAIGGAERLSVLKHSI